MCKALGGSVHSLNLVEMSICNTVGLLIEIAKNSATYVDIFTPSIPFALLS